MDPSQSGFIPNRQILDNILLAYELIKGYGRNGLSPRVMTKIDMMKAYDSLDWKFLEEMMIELGISNRVVGWIMECVTTVSYSIGLHMVPFKDKKRLSQGDPISPYLFAMCVEYPSRCLDTLKNDSRFSFHPKCN